MKKLLVKNNKVIAGYTSGDAIDRTGYLSAIVGVAGTGSVTVAIKDSADGSTFAPVADPWVFLGENPSATSTGLVNIDVDLTSCRQYISFTITGTDLECAVVLGDLNYQPAV